MHSAPPGSVAVNGCPLWRIAVLAIAGTAIGAILGWALGREDAVLASTVLVAAALVAAIAWATSSLSRCPNGRLAWSDDRWRFDPHPSGGPKRGARPVEGTIAVALDLGNVLLLTLHPDPGSPPPGRLARAAARARPCWLPLQRSAVEGDWHGLRVALAAAGRAT